LNKNNQMTENAWLTNPAIEAVATAQPGKIFLPEGRWQVSVNHSAPNVGTKAPRGRGGRL
jgi:hypothetical protein